MIEFALPASLDLEPVAARLGGSVESFIVRVCVAMAGPGKELIGGPPLTDVAGYACVDLPGDVVAVLTDRLNGVPLELGLLTIFLSWTRR